MNLFDSHAHLTDERFDGDRDEVVARMAESGVARCLLIGDAATDAAPALEMAARCGNMWAAAGLHPHDASLWDAALEERLRAWLAHPKCVALGEIGLDYHYDLSPRDVQRAVYEAQLDIALELGLPVILHIRDAHGENTDLLRGRVRAGRMPRGVMHCYTGSWESAKEYLDMGLYLSLSGAVTFKNAPKLSQVAQNLPADRLLVETDCPYMAPVPMRGRRNEPAFVRYTAQRVAELRGVTLEELADQTARNAMALFGIAD